MAQQNKSQELRATNAVERQSMKGEDIIQKEFNEG